MRLATPLQGYGEVSDQQEVKAVPIPTLSCQQCVNRMGKQALSTNAN